jgi:hypothetical protein
MTIIAMASVKGAPGVTTLSCLVASAWPAERQVVLVEDDPSGGDLAARFGLSTKRGWSSYTAASRRLEGIEPIGAHVQQLPGGLDVLVGARSADPVEDLRKVSSLLSSAGSPQGGTWDIIADLGRLLPGERGVELWLERSAAVAIVLRRDAASILHVHDRAAGLRSRCQGRVGLVVVGPGPFPSKEIERFIELPVLAELPDDPNAAQIAGGHPGGASRLSRSLLVLSSKRLATTLGRVVAPVGPGRDRRVEGHEGPGPSDLPPAAGPGDPPADTPAPDGTRPPEGLELTGRGGWRRGWASRARAAGLGSRFESPRDGVRGSRPDQSSESGAEEPLGSPAEGPGDRPTRAAEGAAGARTPVQEAVR